MSDRAPDFIEPIVGWRALKVVRQPREDIMVGGPAHGLPNTCSDGRRVVVYQQATGAPGWVNEEAADPVDLRPLEHLYVRERVLIHGEPYRLWLHNELRGHCIEMVVADLADRGIFERVALASPQQGGHWEPGWMLARCNGTSSHDAPEEGCNCGYHAAHEPGLAAGYMYGESVLLARVELAGKIIPGERGWRAERARLKTLIVAEHPAPDEYATLADVRQLARDYGTELETLRIPSPLVEVGRRITVSIAGSADRLAETLRVLGHSIRVGNVADKNFGARSSGQ